MILLRVFSISLLFSYLSFSFITAEINPFHWEQVERFLLITVTLGGTALLAGVPNIGYTKL